MSIVICVTHLLSYKIVLKECWTVSDLYDFTVLIFITNSTLWIHLNHQNKLKTKLKKLRLHWCSANPGFRKSGPSPNWAIVSPSFVVGYPLSRSAFSLFLSRYMRSRTAFDTTSVGTAVACHITYGTAYIVLLALLSLHHHHCRRHKTQLGQEK